MEQVIAALREQRQQHVDRLMEWLRIPSVSTDSNHDADTRRAGEFILDELRNAGFEARMHETPRHPVVTAEWLGAPGQPTLLVYGHYDVQPPDPLELWRHGAFEPTVEGVNLVARGATDDKGQVLALVRGISGMLTTRGSLPVNVRFLIEGEEEIGSPNLAPFVEAHKDDLAADVVLVSDCSQFGPGQPALTIGLRGLVYFEVKAFGPNRDLHSGSFGGTVTNPANALCEIIGRLKDDDGRVTIPGFYDGVREMPSAQRSEMAALGLDDAEYARELGVEALAGETGFTTVERRSIRPTLDVNGLYSGWTGEGAKTVLPAEAMAKFSMRLVADQDPDVIREATESYLRQLAPAGIRLEIRCFEGAPAILVNRENPFLAAAERAMAQGFGAEPLHIHEGGSIPIVSSFKSILGLDSILMGLGLPDDGAHSPNEKFNLDDYQRGIEAAAYFLQEMAAVQ